MAYPCMGNFIKTSPALGGATSTSTISKGFPGAKATAARDFIFGFPLYHSVLIVEQNRLCNRNTRA